jgi:hypothetical protein
MNNMQSFCDFIVISCMGLGAIDILIGAFVVYLLIQLWRDKP